MSCMVMITTRGSDATPLAVFCAKRSIAEKVHQAVGLRPRRVLTTYAARNAAIPSIA